jgi:hypothetical protein
VLYGVLHKQRRIRSHSIKEEVVIEKDKDIAQTLNLKI